jgi:hypothetical protein|tara:strand:- start:1486 stop:2157 length:672 start_codon:yes stop_codon:yes gene_type:complete
MGLLDNDTVIVDAILTKLGRQKLANGQPLGITQYAFGDTGVDYTLYNPNHPNGSSDYGSAITSLPMLEAVPDDNVFLRFKLYGEGERNVQNFSFITATSGTSVTISKIAGETESSPVTIVPQVFPKIQGALFNYKILDMRGLTLEGVNPLSVNINSGDFNAGNLPPFDHPEPVVANISSQGNLIINTQPQQITSQRSVGVEVSRDGAASTFITLTLEVNNTTA